MGKAVTFVVHNLLDSYKIWLLLMPLMEIMNDI